jgi:cysteine desulfurase NifS/selenium donor protein
MKPIYLDYNATTPIASEVAETMLPFLTEHFGNPSSSHHYGTITKQAIETARKQVATLINARPEEILFTSGGTESNNLAIQGTAFAKKQHGGHIITSAIEHPAVAEVCRWLGEQGFQATFLPVDSTGLVNPEDLRNAIRSDTILVSIMHANNEVGTIQPIRELVDIAHQHGITFHSDAAQSTGKIPIDVQKLGVDLLSIAGHKLYAPKGVGVLYIRAGTPLTKFIHGASHEANRRPGTENVLEITGLGKACEIAKRDLEENRAHLTRQRNLLHNGLMQSLGPDQVKLNGHPEKRLPNTLSLAFRHIEANTLLAEISDQVAASAGAACHADQIDISTVLEAMQVPLEWAMGTIRFSVGRETTSEDIDKAIEIITLAVQRLQPEAGFRAPVIDALKEYPLTQYTHGLGCACKMRPQDLEQILKKMPPITNPSVLVGPETSDDASVFQISDDLAIVQTVDFFTPIVDDPYTFGAIAAANALSDIYAMGAEAAYALNIVGFPSKRLPLRILEDILSGAADKAAEAGIQILGGHTIDDPEPKYGLAVTGFVHPQQVIRNSTAQPGDVLVLTKPIGTGIIATAAKRKLTSPEILQNAIDIMLELNKLPAEIMQSVGVNACTDITGFGLLGHLHEMSCSSGVDVTLFTAKIPILPGARELAAADIVPGGTLNNLKHIEPFVQFDPRLSRIDQLLLCDAQTSGGLLISVPKAKVEDIIQKLKDQNLTADVIGEVKEMGSGMIRIKP